MKSATARVAWHTAASATCNALARHLGLIDAIDEQLHVLKIQHSYFDSDHVLNLAYNSLCDGTCMQDIELRRDCALRGSAAENPKTRNGSLV